MTDKEKLMTCFNDLGINFEDQGTHLDYHREATSAFRLCDIRGEGVGFFFNKDDKLVRIVNET